MSLLRNITSGLRSLFRKERVDRELDEELGAYLEMAAAEKMKQGMTRQEAFRAVRLERGSPEVTKEIVRSATWESFLETCWQDVRFGLRMLRKNPDFTAVVVLMLALGIGANAAIFNTANAVLWRTLPVADPQSLVRLIAVRKDRTEHESIPIGIAEELRRSRNIVSDVITRSDDGLSFSYKGGAAERVVGEVVSANFFDSLGIRPALGQGFSAAVQKGQWAPEVVLSYRFWQRRFGSDPHVLGQSIRQSELLSTADAAIMARLKPGIGIVQAEAAADAACEQFLQDDRFNQHEANPTRHIRLAPGARGWQGDLAHYRTSLLVLVGLACVVLLVASFNLTSMLHARATTRRRELAVRAAIGAGKSRLVRQMFTESTLLATAAGAASLAIMSSTGETILGFLPQGHINVVLNVSPDLRTLWFTAALTVFVGVLMGLVPALYVTRSNLTLALKSDSAASIGDARVAVFRRVLTMGQVALSLLLLTMAGLFERSLMNLRAADPFPEPDRVLVFRMKPQKELYDGQKIRNFTAEVAHRMSTLPGVNFAGLAEEGPYGSRGAMHVTVGASDGRTARSDMDIVSPGLFATLGIPLLNGRDFSVRDGERAKRVVVVDEGLARRLFGNDDAVGKMVEASVQESDVEFEIIGVVGASRYFDLHQSPPPMIFFSLQQAGPYMPTLHVRAGSANTATVVSEVRREFGAIDKNVPIFDIKTLRDRALDNLAQQRLGSDLAAAFGALALTLVTIGLYGLVAYSVAQRTREIGIRVALGAERKQIMRLIAWQGMQVVLIGVALGLPISFLLARQIAGMLYAVHADDPLSFATVMFVLGFVTMLACYIPARRAMRVDPMIALRYE